jgi:hypothetical protein
MDEYLNLMALTWENALFGETFLHFLDSSNFANAFPVCNWTTTCTGIISTNIAQLSSGEQVMTTGRG